MCDELDKAENRGLEKGLVKGLIKGKIEAYLDMSLSIDEIANKLNISADEVKNIIASLEK